MIPDSTIGKLGKYEVLRKLATGGMAEIFLARLRGAAGFEKLCVLKRILPYIATDKRVVQMFLDEARLAARFRNPHIADVFDVGSDQGIYFFAMEFIHGQDARMIRLQAHAAQRPIPLEISIPIIRATAAALAYAHDLAGPDGPLGLVHRDVSPSNILVSYDGAIKLVDFGIARATLRSSITRTGAPKGKVPYMSPEQCQGLALDRRSDLFSLGTTLYELTVGCRPFVGTSDFAIMEHIVNRDAAPPSTMLSGYPAALESIVMKLLAREPAARYPNAAALAGDLDSFTASHKLATMPFAIAKYMRALFARELGEWERAAGHGTSLAQHLADQVVKPAPRIPLESPPYGLIVVRYDSALPPSAAFQEDDATTELDRRDRNPAQGAPLPGGHLARSTDFSQDDPTSKAPASYALRAMALTEADATRPDVVAVFDAMDLYRADLQDELDDATVAGDRAKRAAARMASVLDRARESLERREYDRAVVAVDLAFSEELGTPATIAVLERNDAMIMTIFESYLGDRSRHPVVARQLEDLACLPLGPHAAFLLSRIDGMMSIDDLLDVSGMPRRDACRYLCQLLLLKILR